MAAIAVKPAETAVRPGRELVALSLDGRHICETSVRALVG
jgi:hypothetical protein